MIGHNKCFKHKLGKLSKIIPVAPSVNYGCAE